MNKICAFCGHRLVLDGEVKSHLNTEIEKLAERGFTEFYSGGMGEFDKMCENVVRKYKRKNNEIKLILVLPYMTVAVNRYGDEYKRLYDEIIIPDLGDIHYKRAITERNKWIAEHVDTVITYIRRDYGGAWNMYRYAKKIGTEIIEI